MTLEQAAMEVVLPSGKPPTTQVLRWSSWFVLLITLLIWVRVQYL